MNKRIHLIYVLGLCGSRNKLVINHRTILECTALPNLLVYNIYCLLLITINTVFDKKCFRRFLFKYAATEVAGGQGAINEGKCLGAEDRRRLSPHFTDTSTSIPHTTGPHSSTAFVETKLV